MKRLWLCQALLCGLVMFSTLSSSLGDQIIKTDGKVITGDIISDDGENVVIKQGSVLTTISHRDILTIERKPRATDPLAPAPGNSSPSPSSSAPTSSTISTEPPLSANNWSQTYAGTGAHSHHPYRPFSQSASESSADRAG